MISFQTLDQKLKRMKIYIKTNIFEKTRMTTSNSRKIKLSQMDKLTKCVIEQMSTIILYK